MTPADSVTMPRMSRQSIPSRWLKPLVLSLLAVALAAPQSRAADLDLTAPESIVRSAPFEVAPEIARVHAGEKLSGDDQAQGSWRRVQLKDGRRGFIHDADARVAAAPVVPAKPAETGPQRARIAVLELGVRATASTDAPILRMLHQNDEVIVYSDPQAGWRRIEGAEGQGGFVPEAGLAMAEAPPPAAVPISTGGPQPAAAPTTPETTADLTLLGVLFEIMPVGTLSTSEAGVKSVSSDTAFAVAVAPFLDVPGSPYFALGFSPQIIFGVKGSNAAQSATEYDLRARLTTRYPMAPNAQVYARFSPAYSIVSLPSPPAGLSNPAGFLLDLSVGAEIAVLPKLFVVIDLGYQIGFQSTSDVDGTPIDFDSRYLHIGAGLAVGL